MRNMRKTTLCLWKKNGCSLKDEMLTDDWRGSHAYHIQPAGTGHYLRYEAAGGYPGPTDPERYRSYREGNQQKKPFAFFRRVQGKHGHVWGKFTAGIRVYHLCP